MLSSTGLMRSLDTMVVDARVFHIRWKEWVCGGFVCNQASLHV